VLPGTYQIDLMGADVLSSSRVEVRWDPLMPMSEGEIRARYDYTVALYELQQTGYHAQVQAGQILEMAQEGVDSLEAGLQPRADSLMAEMEGALQELRRRNADLRGWWRGLIGEFDGGPSVIGSMTAPTESQNHRLEWTQEAFRKAVQELDRVIAETVPALNLVLEEEDSQAIEVPTRGSGPEPFR
jgi:hypothetical protein